jgi:hypothetical protein
VQDEETPLLARRACSIEQTYFIREQERGLGAAPPRENPFSVSPSDRTALPTSIRDAVQCPQQSLHLLDQTLELLAGEAQSLQVSRIDRLPPLRDALIHLP